MIQEDLYKDLLAGFMQYQYRVENPFPTDQETHETIRDKYLTDPVFKAKVDNLTAGVLQIINNNIDLDSLNKGESTHVQ